MKELAQWSVLGHDLNTVNKPWPMMEHAYRLYEVPAANGTPVEFRLQINGQPAFGVSENLALACEWIEAFCPTVRVMFYEDIEFEFRQVSIRQTVPCAGCAGDISPTEQVAYDEVGNVFHGGCHHG